MSFHPQTPQSPSQFSPSTSDIIMSVTSSMTTISTALPTPAHSVNGSSIPSEMTHDMLAGDDTPHKRKRPTDDVGERQKKKVQIEDRRTGIENLHLDVGEKYLLCRTPHPPSKPLLSEDLFELYGLTGIAAGVARVLPNGDKNAIRKTYKGHIKKLGVQGHFDSVDQDPDRPDSILNLAKYPVDEWDVHFVRGKDIVDGFSSETKAKLLRAATMGKGVIPRHMWDSSVLGDIGSVKSEKQTTSARPTAPNTPLTATPGFPRAKTNTPVAQEANRPKRGIKKRSYGDSSFEGYGDGFPDDGAETGYSTGEGDMAPGLKRRKKVATDGFDPD
ncbi:mediator of RNA polymerase II transcription subunit 19 [Lasiosphaeria miniovina]|uniref:Mediator of RNA polymerase II transcription subunit 19 n=1 Tax=Lasiosphaeria miniovina TaxID=1954250 RepID=A0AA40B658_9PEZI|nr:mediator of RNA polymerase II transcription subunit 19 [Lasiosphaeria miniovina]KAK0728289.1 mediator of RNA polymerase II transcription subunit 19 [Lasiosphaeria miniovina]